MLKRNPVSVVDPNSFPEDEFKRVKYSMAKIRYAMTYGLLSTPSSKAPIKLHKLSNNKLELLYLWTAAMVFGMHGPNKFGNEAIESYVIASIAVFDPKDQLGWISTFSDTSLYETKFKHNLSKFMLDINISGIISPSFKIGPLYEFYMHHYFLDEFEASRKFDGGYFLPHDGYLKLANLIVEGFRENPVNKMICLRGEMRKPLVEAIMLYCQHIIFECVDQTGNRTILSSSEISKYNDRIGHRSSGSYMFRPAALEEFKNQIGLLPSIRYRLDEIEIAEGQKSAQFQKAEELAQEKMKEVTENETQDAENIKLELERKRQEDLKRREDEERRRQEDLKKREEQERKRQEEYRKKQQEEEEKVRLELQNEVLRICACQEGRMRASYLAERLAKGIDINYQDKETGNTALIIALDCQNDHLAEFLLRNGANPFLKNRLGRTAADYTSSSSPIMDLIRSKQKEMDLMKESTQARLNRELQEEVESISPHARKIKSLLESGADINHQNTEGYTVLMLAADNQNDRLVEYLLKQGADPLLPNKHDELGVLTVSLCDISRSYSLI